MVPSSPELLSQLTQSDATYWRASDDGLLRVPGGDRVRFLNGMLTQDVAALERNRAISCLQLDRKGHVLGVLWLIALEDSIWLDVASQRAAAVHEMLDKHLIADDVTVESVRDSAVAVLEGPDPQRGSDAPPLEAGCVSHEGSPEAPGLRGAEAGLTRGALRLIGPESWVEQCIAEYGEPELGEDEREALRIRARQPLWGCELGERTFPAEAGLDAAAISFEKGWYIGQEIVARIHSRGAVNRRLVRLDCDSSVTVGASVSSDGRTVGEITSASQVGPPQALAYLRAKGDQALGAGTRVEVAGTLARVSGA